MSHRPIVSVSKPKALHLKLCKMTLGTMTSRIKTLSIMIISITTLRTIAISAAIDTLYNYTQNNSIVRNDAQLTDKQNKITRLSIIIFNTALQHSAKQN